MRRSTPITLFEACFILIAAGPLWAQTNSQRHPVARVNGEIVYEEDLLPSIRAQMVQIQQQEYDLRIRALESLVIQRALEAEAKLKGVPTPEALLSEAVDGRIPSPQENEIEAFYLAQKDRINRPLSEVRPQLEQALLQAKRQQARQAYIDGLRKKAEISLLIDRPRIEVTADPARTRGNPKAPVTIIEFSDFQCPYCRAAQPVLKELLAKYKDQVRLGYRDYPLRNIHPQAQQAAEASRCAAEQGKFWEFHDLIYADPSKLDLKGLSEQAHAAGLESGRFQQCLDAGRFRTAIEDDVQTGALAGVSGTPAFYINGVLLTGAQGLAAFERVIDTELASAHRKP